MKMTNEQLLNLFGGLKAVGELSGVKFAYAVARNVVKLQKYIEPLIAAKKPTSEFAKFQVERTAIAQDHAVKDEKGVAMTEMVSGVERFVIRDEKKFQVELKVLKDKNKELIKVREKQIEEFKKLLSQEVEVELYMVKFSSVPKSITSNQMATIMPIVEE